MTHRRRALLKGLVVALPPVWTRPVVESMVLPAHAQTSPGECTAEAGCYIADPPGLDTFSFSWPGGSGPFVVEGFENLDCEGIPDDESVGPIVVAADAEAAAVALSCGDPSECVLEVPTDPPLTVCNFFARTPS